MGLQVRLVHSLGDRLIDLPEKSMDAPIVIGRSGDADVPIPSVTISRRHCVMFMEDGRWMLQDMSGGRTYLNGQQAVGAMAILSHDVVTLGNDPSPPTLVIDPYGLDASAQGSSEEAEVEPSEQARTDEAPRPIQPYGGYAAPLGGLSVPQLGTYAGRAVTPSSRGARASQFVSAEQPGEDGPAAAMGASMSFNGPPSAEAPAGDPASDWMTQRSAPAKARDRSRVPQKKKSSTGTMIGIGAALTVAIVGGAAYIIHANRPQTVEAPIPAPVENHSKATSIFDFGAGPGSGKSPGTDAAPAPAPAPAAPLPRVVVHTPAPAPAPMPIDPAAEEARNSDPKWQNLTDVHRNFDPVRAIVIYNDFARDNAPNLYAAELRQFTDDALDRIWWGHIADLMTRREDATKEVEAKAEELAQSADPEFKKGIEAEKAAAAEKIAKATADLAELKYSSKEKPNLYDPNQIMELRQARDPEIFNDWKQRAEGLIKSSRGDRSLW